MRFSLGLGRPLELVNMLLSSVVVLLFHLLLFSLFVFPLINTNFGQIQLLQEVNHKHVSAARDVLY